jgi:hypothetical protein
MTPVEVVVKDKMQRGYSYLRTEPEGEHFDPRFRPHLTPKQMLELGVFGGKYMTDCRDEFPAEWFTKAKLSPEKHDKSLNFFKVDASLEPAFAERIDAFTFNEAMDLIFEHVGKGDEYMTTKEPYKKIKDEATAEEARADIARLVAHLAKIAVHLAPVMPATADAILSAVRENKKPENLFPRLG